MTSKVSLDEAFERYGIRCAHEEMDNGELRFRLIAPDGSSYIRTVASHDGAWQNSHFHKRIRETYIVEDGWMVVAEFDEETERMSFKKFTSGDIVTTSILVKHNVYMAAGSIIHTVKHGALDCEPDWHPSPEVDKSTKHISEQDLRDILNAT